MGEEFMNFTNFFDFWLRSSRYKRYFLPVLSGICGENFSDEWKVVPVAPQRGDVHPDKSRGVLSDILVTASR